jgi:4-aminobutyrate aminotransferase-like enzyme
MEQLKHPRIRAVRAAGLLIAVEFASFEENKKIIDACLARGIFTDWFLFAPHCLRIAPPLVITDDDIRHAIENILDAILA